MFPVHPDGALVDELDFRRACNLGHREGALALARRRGTIAETLGARSSGGGGGIRWEMDDDSLTSRQNSRGLRSEYNVGDDREVRMQDLRERMRLFGWDGETRAKCDEYLRRRGSDRLVGAESDEQARSEVADLLSDVPEAFHSRAIEYVRWRGAHEEYVRHKRAEMSSLFDGITRQDRDQSSRSRMKQWARFINDDDEGGQPLRLEVGDTVRLFVGAIDAASADTAYKLTSRRPAGATYGSSTDHIPVCDRRLFPCGPQARMREKTTDRSHQALRITYSRQVYVVTRVLDRGEDAPSLFEEGTEERALDDALAVRYAIERWRKVEADCARPEVLASTLFTRRDLLHVRAGATSVARPHAHAIALECGLGVKRGEVCDDERRLRALGWTGTWLGNSSRSAAALFPGWKLGPLPGRAGASPPDENGVATYLADGRRAIELFLVADGGGELKRAATPDGATGTRVRVGLVRSGGKWRRFDPVGL